MTANFFQKFDRRGVEYLLISGQATVLYGAATFSEDIDLWVNPTEENRRRFLAALADCEACYYKLTPPLTVKHLEAGHGFHFVLPAMASGEIYLDIMGNPPRAGSFAAAMATARNMETEWGTVPTIGIKPLVELKKTQRLQDYPIISKLALAWFAQPECKFPETDFPWAWENIFTLPDLGDFFTEHPAAVSVASRESPEIGEFGRQFLQGGQADEAIEHHLTHRFQARMAELQGMDRSYWRAIIQQLKELRGKGGLLPEGEKVSAPD